MAVFHLKYRPKKISDLDLPEVSKTLSMVLASKDRPGSFLLAGPKGSGKTSSARILARAVNCEKPVGIEACGKCANCKEIETGASMDVIEIDGASNRGIDDIRLIKERAYLLPSKLKVKVFVIDEVHMLTKEAFNALLKILEEPPKHTLFILCTTDPEKIPETVLSRLVRIDFRKGSKEELLASVKRVIKAEKLIIKKEALDFLIDKSDGSFRNLHKTINEIFMENGKKIDLKQVKKYFSNRVGEYGGEQLEEDLRLGKTKHILSVFEKMAEKGVVFSQLRIDYLVYFQKKLLESFEAKKERKGLEREGLESFLQLLIEAGKQEKFVEIDQLPLQLAVVDFGREYGPKENIKVERQSVKVAGAKVSGVESRGVNKKSKVLIKKKEAKTRLRQDSGEAKPTYVKDSGEVKEVKKVKVTNPDLTMTLIEKKWPEVLAAVKPFNHSVEAFMRSARPKKVEENKLVLEVFYPFHKDKLEEEKNRKIVENGLAKIFDCQLFLDCVLGEGNKKPVVMTEVKEEDEGQKKDLKDGDLYDVAKEIFG